LGLYNDNILKGIALINGRKITLGGMYFECNYGPNINFNNSLEVKYFFQEIKTFLYEKGATYFSFNPHIKLNIYDLNGNFLENKKDYFNKQNMENFKKQRNDYKDDYSNVTIQKEDNINTILKTLRKLKYHHHNLSENRNGKWDMRWFFIKNLENITKENLLNS